MGRDYCSVCGCVGCDGECEPTIAPEKCPKCNSTMHIVYHGNGDEDYECQKCFHEIENANKS